MDGGHGTSKCSRKASLSIFFFVELLAFTLCLVSLLSPSWQYVYLENGRTEHHHGLWLDCKRDYSFDYGRTREYYETLYRRDFQGSPFEMFFLPPLECVYKFDYYIDPEDLYDHNHDENRLQDDAYQHLFLGHKIAALVACGVSLMLAASALLAGICAYCHRTFIAAMAVLVTLAAILSTIGIAVFYAWANYQDNASIKQQDEHDTYQQQLGWAFYFSVAGALLHFLASVLGCLAASVAAVKGRSKLVRIDVSVSLVFPSTVLQVVGGGGADLLSAAAHSSSLSTAPFSPSFSAIYKVDSTALRQWERDYMHKAKARQSQESFQRTASMPMLARRLRQGSSRSGRAARASLRATSSSNLFDAAETTTTGTTNTLESVGRTRRPPSIPTPEPPKSVLKTPQLQRRVGEASGDTTYEYLPGDDASLTNSSFLATRCNAPSRGVVYDAVYDDDETPNTYLQPNSRSDPRTQDVTRTQKKVLLPTLAVSSGSAQSIPSCAPPPRSALFHAIQPMRPSTTLDTVGEEIHRRRIQEKETIEEMERLEMVRRGRPQQRKGALLPPQETVSTALGVRDFGIGLIEHSNGYYTEMKEEEEEEMPAAPSHLLCLNTFDARGSQRSLTSLTWRPTGQGNVDAFERPDSSVDILSTPPLKKRQSAQADLRRRLLLGTLPDEVDRSCGGSTLLENETMRDSGSAVSSYARDAELRLNLFLADSPRSSAPTPPPKPPSTISLSSPAPSLTSASQHRNTSFESSSETTV